MANNLVEESRRLGSAMSARLMAGVLQRGDDQRAQQMTGVIADPALAEIDDQDSSVVHHRSQIDEPGVWLIFRQQDFNPEMTRGPKNVPDPLFRPTIDRMSGFDRNWPILFWIGAIASALNLGCQDANSFSQNARTTGSVTRA